VTRRGAIGALARVPFHQRVGDRALRARLRAPLRCHGRGRSRPLAGPRGRRHRRAGARPLARLVGPLAAAGSSRLGAVRQSPAARTRTAGSASRAVPRAHRGPGSSWSRGTCTRNRTALDERDAVRDLADHAAQAERTWRARESPGSSGARLAHRSVEPLVDRAPRGRGGRGRRRRPSRRFAVGLGRALLGARGPRARRRSSRARGAQLLAQRLELGEVHGEVALGFAAGLASRSLGDGRLRGRGPRRAVPVRGGRACSRRRGGLAALGFRLGARKSQRGLLRARRPRSTSRSVSTRSGARPARAPWITCSSRPRRRAISSAWEGTGPSQRECVGGARAFS